MTNILSSSGGLDYPQYFPETSIDFLNNRSIPPEYTFIRNSAGTYVGADGLIKTAAANEPRFEYDVNTGEFKGLLVEESRTNIAWLSTQVYSGLPTIAIPNSEIAPDGTFTAWLVQSYGFVSNQFLMSYPNYWSLSFFVKPGPGAVDVAIQVDFLITIVAYFNFTTKTFTASGFSYEEYPNGWYKIKYTKNQTSYIGGHTLRSGFRDGSGNFTRGYLWGLQVEQGSFPTSYIPTSGSAVTRQPDQLTLNRPFNSLGTFFVEATPTTGTTVSADNGTSGLVMSSTGKEALYYNTNRTLRMPSDYSADSFSTTPPQDLNRVSLGFDKLNNTNYINGYLKKFMYYGSPVTEDNLRSLTGNTKEIFRYKWTPEELDTSLWFSADDVSTIIESGGEVNTWLDKSGNNRDGITSSPYTKPSYSIQSFNGKGSIYFDSTDLIIIPGFNLDLSPFTIIFVGEGNLSSAGINNVPRLYFNNNGISYVDNFIASWIEDGTKRIVSWTFDGIDSHIVHRNATSIATATKSATFGLVNDYIIGRAGSPYSNGAFCEYIVLREKISDSNRQKLEGYLAHKWGLRDILPNNHPYKTSLPV